jgi:SAM-dependent methyltransferase
VELDMNKLGRLTTGWAAWEALWWLHSRWERHDQWRKARALADETGKGLLVVGAPMGMYPCGDTTVDLEDPSACCPAGGVEASVENLPFADGQFGAVYVSHVLEHVCRPDVALEELHRVADHVVVSYPRFWRAITWFSPGHTWLMWPSSDPERDWNFLRLRADCNQPGFLGRG